MHGSHVRHSTRVLLPAFSGEKIEIDTAQGFGEGSTTIARTKKHGLGKCRAAPLERVPGRNSLAASHPALAAVSGTAEKFCSLLSVVRKLTSFPWQ